MGIFALVLALATAMPAPATTPAPVEIYRKALQHLAALPQPAYIDDTELWNTVAVMSIQEIPESHTQRVLFDSTARRECVLFVPYSPRNPSLIGQSYFAPDTWLVHHPAATQQTSSASNFAPDLSDLKTIANVVTVAKPAYDIRLAGIDSLTHGGAAYHLTLRPLSDPHRHNLRDLWVNTTTSNIIRAIMVGTYSPDPQSLAQETTVSEDFGQVGPYWVVIHHTWSYRDVDADVTFKYEASSVKMSFPQAIPAWYFDTAEFNRHRDEVNLTSEWP